MRKRKLFRFISLGKKSTKNLKADYYIFGLGNKGEKYAGTRHNAGFDILDTIANAHHVVFSDFAYKGIYTKITADEKTIMLIKPQTYMNNSGQCVSEFVRAQNIEWDKIIIIYDDIDINVAAVRIKERGSAGTHNGLRSIIYHLRSDQFTRVRVGIGRPKNKEDLIDYVIGKYDESDFDMMKKCYKDAGDAAITICESGVTVAQSKYNFKGIKS